MLYRARHSTTDNDFKSVFSNLGIPTEYVRPIKISKAIGGLASRHGFASAVSLYGSLSNICHHNGSGHKMLADSYRETNTIFLRDGQSLTLREKAVAFKMKHPDLRLAKQALAKTARLAWWSAHSANQLISDLPESPLTDRELRVLTGGRLRSVKPFDSSIGPGMARFRHGKSPKVGRNDPCACGSGKKYKVCCWKTQIRR